MWFDLTCSWLAWSWAKQWAASTAERRSSVLFLSSVIWAILCWAECSSFSSCKLVQTLKFNLMLHFQAGIFFQFYTIKKWAKHPFVLIHIKNKGEVGTMKLVKPSSKKILTDHSKEVLLLWNLFVICVSCLSCCLVCSLQPCGHLLGKG